MLLEARGARFELPNISIGRVLAQSEARQAELRKGREAWPLCSIPLYFLKIKSPSVSPCQSWPWVGQTEELKAGLSRLEDLKLSSFIISQEIRVPQFLNFSSLAERSLGWLRGA